MAKARWRSSEGRPDRRPGGHPGGARPGLLGADLAGDVPAVEQDPLLARRLGAELHAHGARHGDVLFDVIRIESLADAGQRDQPVQRAAVEQVPAQRAATMRLMVPLPELEGPSMVTMGTEGSRHADRKAIKLPKR